MSKWIIVVAALIIGLYLGKYKGSMLPAIPGISA